MNRYHPLIKPGHLEVYCGPMKSGKSFEMIARVEKINYMDNRSCHFFKPTTDTRDGNLIKSRFGNLERKCFVVGNPSEIIEVVDRDKDTSLIVIDEAQFFSNDLVPVVKRLLSEYQLNVILGGLDLDFRGEPFGPMPVLLSLADEVHKLTAMCSYPKCENQATRTQRLIDGSPAHYNSPIISIEMPGKEEGLGRETYEARCIRHHKVPGAKNMLSEAPSAPDKI